MGVIFLNYISDAFEEAHARLKGEKTQGARSRDLLSRVHEYILSQIVNAEGKKGANSTSRAAWPSSWSRYWSRYWNHIIVGSTIHAAVRPACSFGLSALGRFRVKRSSLNTLHTIQEVKAQTRQLPQHTWEPAH